MVVTQITEYACFCICLLNLIKCWLYILEEKTAYILFLEKAFISLVNNIFTIFSHLKIQFSNTDELTFSGSIKACFLLVAKQT